MKQTLKMLWKMSVMIKKFREQFKTSQNVMKKTVLKTKPITKFGKLHK